MNRGKDMERYKCIECQHCDVEKKKCFPGSRDCHSEYDLTDDDIYKYSTERCDFFKRRT